MKFEEFNLNEQVLEAISYMNFEKATPIQEQAIPFILEDKDLIACAQTGTGKTAAFLLPILHKLAENPSNHINTLILVPTRELAIQIEKQIQGFSYFVAATSIAIYGGGDGKDWSIQKRGLTQGTNVIIATPGKLLSHLRLGYADLTHLEHLILDEADRMLDMGFHEDITNIISYLPEKRQNLMFSATMPPKIRKLAKEILDQPEEIQLSISKPAEGILQAVYLTYPEQKIPLITRLLRDKPYCESIVIFGSTRRKVQDVLYALQGEGLEVEYISSDLEQSEREAVLSRFKSKKTRILVATDVISRGIDIKDIQLVINFDVPGDAEDYVHRVGRTARAGKSGMALTFVDTSDMGKFARIEKLIGITVNKVPLPTEIGEGPQWRDRRFGKSNGKKPRSYNNKNKRNSRSRSSQQSDSSKN